MRSGPASMPAIRFPWRPSRVSEQLPGRCKRICWRAREVKRYYSDLVAWKRDFDRAQREGEAQSAARTARKGTRRGRCRGGRCRRRAAAAAAGQCRARGGASRLRTHGAGAGHRHGRGGSQCPARTQSEDQVRPGYEGGPRLFFGFPSRHRKSLRQPASESSRPSCRMPWPSSCRWFRPRTRFDFAPRLAAFQQAAHELGLYPEDGISHD